jgi:hypothetical protein
VNLETEIPEFLIFGEIFLPELAVKGQGQVIHLVVNILDH